MVTFILVSTITKRTGKSNNNNDNDVNETHFYHNKIEGVDIYYIFFLSFGCRPPQPRSVLIIGWWSSNPRTAATIFLDSVPFLLRIMCYFFPSSNDGSGTPSLPLQNSPGLLVLQGNLPGHTLSLLLLPLLRSFFCLFCRPPPATPVVTRRLPV